MPDTDTASGAGALGGGRADGRARALTLLGETGEAPQALSPIVPERMEASRSAESGA